MSPSQIGINRERRTVTAFAAERRMTLDGLAVGSTMPLINFLIQADVSKPKAWLEQAKGASEMPPSFTAYLVACLGRTVAEHPVTHAIQSWRGLVTTFAAVDIATLIEVNIAGSPLPIIHVLRNTEQRSVTDLAREIQQIKRDPQRSPVVQRLKYLPWYSVVPGWIRRSLMRLIAKWPRQMKRQAGTVVMTSLGSLGLSGYVLPTPTIYNLTLAVGGISYLPGPNGPRPMLHLTISANHQIVDGGPLARFAAALQQRIEGGDAALMPEAVSQVSAHGLMPESEAP